jgi:CheY-like chemotaxis protein
MGKENALPVRRVLVVDDDRELADAAVKLLKSMGQIVWQANDGATAVSMTLEFSPDVVFLDLVMPGMDGLEVARQLRDSNLVKTPKIVALTSFRQPAFRDAASWAGFDAYITKPASVEALSKVLADLRSQSQSG